MPNYTYQCFLNKHRVEIQHSIFYEPLEMVCAECQSPMQRKPQPTAIEFKSSGFYSKDSRDA